MIKFWFICAVAAFVMAGIAYVASVYVSVSMGASPAEFIKVYQDNARTPIFSGFLTMGSFLLAMKTNIISRLQQTYDTEEHRVLYLAINQDLPPEQKSKFYAGLENLSSALGWNVVACLITSILQMTLGFWPHPVPFSICAGSAGACLGLLVYLTAQLMAAHRDWFRTIEKQAQKKLSEEE